MTPPRVIAVSPAQYDALRELAHDGASNADIADRLGTTIDSVKYRLSAVMGAARCRDRTELVCALWHGRVRVRVRGRDGRDQ